MIVSSLSSLHHLYISVRIDKYQTPSVPMIPSRPFCERKRKSNSEPYYPGQKVKIAVNAAYLKPKEGGARIKIKDNEDTFDLPVLEKNKGVYEAVYVPTHPGTVVAEVCFGRTR